MYKEKEPIKGFNRELFNKNFFKDETKDYKPGKYTEVIIIGHKALFYFMKKHRAHEINILEIKHLKKGFKLKIENIWL